VRSIIRYVILLAAATAATAAPVRAPAQTPSGPSTVYWAPSPGEARHLSNIRQLTFGGSNAEAYFSADGTRLIFQRKASPDPKVGCDQEYIMNVDGSDMHRISNGAGRTTCGYFINGDRRIVYSSTFAYDPACPPLPPDSLGYIWPLSHLEIYSARPDGSDLRALTHNGAYNAEATASPDGKRLVFTSTMHGDIDLYTMNIDGSDVRQVTNRLGYDGGAYFSPDGSKIVWRAAYPATHADTVQYKQLLAMDMVRPFALEIWMANADGSNPHQVTHLGGANWAPFFLPDGKRIIFASNYQHPTSGNFDLYLVNTDGTGLEQITTYDDFDGFPMFSPDGHKLVFVSARHSKGPGEINIFIADWKN
jgi:TolB protein